MLGLQESKVSTRDNAAAVAASRLFFHSFPLISLFYHHHLSLSSVVLSLYFSSS